MPHFECGAFNHSATSPVADAAREPSSWSAGRLAWRGAWFKTSASRLTSGRRRAYRRLVRARLHSRAFAFAPFAARAGRPCFDPKRQSQLPRSRPPLRAEPER